MAATKNDSNKRKRPAGSKPDPEKTQIKKPKSPGSSNKGFDKSLKSSKNESPATNKFNKFQKSSDNVEKSVPKTKKEARILAKVSSFYLPMFYFLLSEVNLYVFVYVFLFQLEMCILVCNMCVRL